MAVGGAAQGNALSADLVEESEVDRASQEEEECSFPLLGREEALGAMVASLDEGVEGEVAESSSSALVEEEEEGAFSASSAESYTFKDSFPLAGIEDRVWIAANTLLSILSEPTLITTTTTPAPTAASTTTALNTETSFYSSHSGSAEHTEDIDPAATSSSFPFEDVDDVTLDSYTNELLEEDNLFDFPLSSDTSNTTTTTTTTAALKVKTEVEEPDWNDVHQQGEELHMRPYQRRFENRPLETRVLFLDPDTSNTSLGDDEEIGKEITVKKEPSSEDEEEMGIHWEDAHRMSVRALRDRSNVEVPEEIRRKGARIGLDSLVVSEPSSSSAPSLSSSSSSSSPPSSSSEEEKEDEEDREDRKEEKRFDSRMESQNIRRTEADDEKEESSSGAESLVVSVSE